MMNLIRVVVYFCHFFCMYDFNVPEFSRGWTERNRPNDNYVSFWKKTMFFSWRTLKLDLSLSRVFQCFKSFVSKCGASIRVKTVQAPRRDCISVLPPILSLDCHRSVFEGSVCDKNLTSKQKWAYFTNMVKC